MTNDNPPLTPALTLSDKLMAMNHLTTFVPEKLDVDAMNYSSWVYCFSHLCHGYGILDHLVLDILHTCSITKERLVDLNPTTAKDAWTYIEAIFQDNKRPRAMALKAKLRNLKLGDLSIDGYFQKIESIVSVLNGVGSPLSNDDVVTFALEGLPSTYEMISTIIVSREPFPKGSCRFGYACKYLHNGVHGKSTLLPRTLGSASSVTGVTRSDLDMLQSLLAKFGLNALNISTPSPPVAYTVFVPPGFQSVSAQLSVQPTYVSPQLLSGSFGVSNMGMAGLFPQGVQYPTGSPQQRVHLVPGTSQPPIQFTTGVQQQQGGSFPGSVHLGQSPSMPFHPSQLFTSRLQGSSQATHLLNAFHTTTLQKPASGNWNMDTGASSHLNDSVHCLSDILNMCIYPSVAVGDRRLAILYPVMNPSTIPHAFLTSHYMWHQCLGHPRSKVLRRLMSSDSISCNKEKLPVLCHACQLGKHVKLPFVSSSSSVTSCFDIVHSDLWTSPIPSLSGF
ncbi:ribonuclease H-like domain-containing protein [Tanacetum coccineum]